MELNRYEYLKITRYKNISTWDVKRYIRNSISFKYDVVQLRDILFPYKEYVSKEELLQNGWRIISKINFSGKLFLRNIEDAKTFKGKLNKVNPDSLIYSKINVKHGCIYYHPLGATPFGVSSEYPTYKIDSTKILADYLVLIMQSKYLKSILSKETTGISKARIKSDTFLGVQIPLPSIEIQKKIVEEYKNKIQEAEKLEKQMVTKYANINTLLFTELGVEISKDTIFKSLSTISFSSLDRWDIGYLQNSSKFSAKYKPIKFRDCIDCFMKTSEGKSLRMETFKIPSKNFHYIGMEHIEKATGQLLDIPIVKGSQIKSQTVVVPNGYFIYGKLRPYLNKYWLNNTNWDDIVCSSELFVFKIKNSINTRFFELVLGSNIVQEQIADLTSGARMPRITEDIFMNIRIPIPPIEIQNSIVSNIDSIAENIKDLKILALQKRTMALQNFETEIFE